MHVDQVEGILALFLICLRQIATSKKLLNRLSGFLDDIHHVPPVQHATRVAPMAAPPDAQFTLRYSPVCQCVRRGAMSAFGPKQTSLVALHMSASDVKRTWAFAPRMSACNPKRTSKASSARAGWRTHSVVSVV